MEKKRVLIFPAGAENALEIYDALCYNVNVELFGASGKEDFSQYRYDEDHYIQGDFYINKPEFILGFNKVLYAYAIDVVIPTHDDIALFLAEHREEIKAKILVSEARTAKICRQKSLTYALFQNEDFCPYVIKKQEEVKEYPLFLKRDTGAGGVGAKIISQSLELKDEYFGANYVLCEYLPGQEVTVDCFTDRHHNLRFAGVRSRDRIQMGIAFRSTAQPLTKEIKRIAERINDRLSFFGAWYFQLREDKNGRYKLLEVSCRQAGTMTLYRHLGINFPLLGIFETYNVDTSSIFLDAPMQLERCLHTAFKSEIKYGKVYLDFDDTLVIRGKVCGAVIRFLYQCKGEGIPIVLISRHENESLENALVRYSISSALFESVIHLKEGEKKSDYIKPQGAIFIDNSFAERQEVYSVHHIPVIDVDAVDMLLKEGV